MHIYNKEFYEDQQNGSYISAKEILPIIFDLINPKSIVDVGCGVGTWLSVCQELGVDDVLGLDGPYVLEEMLKISATKFKKTDLSKPVNISRKFDLAMSLEVAEHLSESSADCFVESLTNLSPFVFFSAAIPLQGGHNHVNEQWQGYWADRFFKKGYIAIDCIRPAVWGNDAVEWWYAQNALLFVKKEVLDSRTDLQLLHQNTHKNQLNLVHPKNHIRFFDATRVSLFSVLKSLPKRVLSSFK
ncbi:MAG: methyltransferase domain-containing protein [Candidatus Moranbacteria bacterium]|nr:methyltransferase domain-containing protein [Candidatus Moranbacteria bacterium]MDD3964943.1 methyltransferase domain-containing protein [Candidatus Moranbacteria bacterium]